MEWAWEETLLSNLHSISQRGGQSRVFASTWYMCAVERFNIQIDSVRRRSNCFGPDIWNRKVSVRKISLRLLVFLSILYKLSRECVVRWIVVQCLFWEDGARCLHPVESWPGDVCLILAAPVRKYYLSFYALWLVHKCYKPYERYWSVDSQGFQPSGVVFYGLSSHSQHLILWATEVTYADLLFHCHHTYIFAIHRSWLFLYLLPSYFSRCAWAVSLSIWRQWIS